MLDWLISFVSSHQTIGGLVYSWGSFQVGRMYHGMGKPKGAFLWSSLGVVSAFIYLIVGCLVGQWIGAAFLALTIAIEIVFLRRWFSSPPAPPSA